MDKPQNKQVDEFAKLSWGERIAYGAGDLAQNLIFGTIGSMLLFYLTTVFGISAAVGATIFLIVRWVNVFWDPWVGTVVDKSHFTRRQIQAIFDLLWKFRSRSAVPCCSCQFQPSAAMLPMLS